MQPIPPDQGSPSRLAVVLTIAFVIAMSMGIGPGVLLVNRPTSFLGLPLLYVWGIFWYLVIVVIALISYRYVWHDESHDKSDRTT